MHIEDCGSKPKRQSRKFVDLELCPNSENRCLAKFSHSTPPLFIFILFVSLINVTPTLIDIVNVIVTFVIEDLGD